MLHLPNGNLLAESTDDLPDFTGTDTLYLDVETTGLEPYLGDRLAGVAALRDDERQAVYVPCDHFRGTNVPREAFDRWLADTVRAPRRWVNHNIKFDAHFCAENGAVFDCELWDTLTLAKTHDTDKLRHGLKPLAKEWLGMEMAEEDRVKAYLKDIKVPDAGYAALPADLCGEYACVDVQANRELMRYLEKNRHEKLAGIWDTEVKLTPVLFDMERRGIRVNKIATKKRAVLAMRRLLELEDELRELTGQEFTDSNKHLLDILIVQNGLPILNWNFKYGEDGQVVSSTPSFDKEALVLYQLHPQVTGDPKLVRLFELLVAYRKLHQFWALYLRPYDELSSADGTLHPFYNQVVRTGRMSGSHPNPQQLNKEAKELIEPRDGCAYLSADASQVEFRMIVHYTRDRNAIEAFNTDPKTDYHQWVADMVGCGRKSGKMMNFLLAFGGGKKKVLSALSKSADLMEEIRGQAGSDEEFNELCMERAAEIWNTYHDKLPGIRETSYRANQAAKIRGFVWNAFGRLRHLPRRRAHIAFNAIIQSTAMDYIKTRMIELAPRYCSWMRDAGVDLLINVHDELVFEGPVDVITDVAFQQRVDDILCYSPVEFRVPLRWGLGVSRQHWRAAVEAAGAA